MAAEERGGKSARGAMLPSLAELPCTGVPLRGVRRPGGRRASDEDAQVSRSTPQPLTVGSGEDRLRAVASELRSGRASPSSISQRWREAVRASMAFKRAKYQREVGRLQVEIDDAQRKAALFVQAARSGPTPLADDKTGNWEVAENVSQRWQTLVTQAAALQQISENAQLRHDLINNASDFGTLRGELADAMVALADDYESQGLLLEAVADIVDSFLNAPTVQSNALLNFVLMGNPGAGKTRLAIAVAELLGKLGLFVYEQVATCGRSDFIAEYEGQTAVKTRTFLNSQLEKVIFLDEAYSLTEWETERDGRRTPSAYSAEATTELVAFLSQRVGSVCFIAAGYEREMLDYFLPANDGLSRRFPLRIWLTDYTADQLVSIFITNLAVALSPPPPSTPLSNATVQSYFTTSAFAFLTDLLNGVRGMGVTGAPLYPLLDSIFRAQAGAMVTLANVTAVLITSHREFGRLGLSDRGLDTWALGILDVYDVLRTLLQQQLGPGASLGVKEVHSIATARGWLTAGGWQVPRSDGRGRDGSTQRAQRPRRA